LVTTSKNPWILSILTHYHNPYDGSTLKESLMNAEELSKEKIKKAFADKGYRGTSHHPEGIKIHIPEKKIYLRHLKN
jgi:transposase, IS5 family